MMKKPFALLLAACLGWNTSAQAQTCTTSSTSIAFGQYNPQNVANQDASGTVTVTCTAVLALLISYTVKLGSGTSGAYAQRKMGGTTTPLNYQVYTDSAHSLVWGDGTSSTNYVSDSYLLALLGSVIRNYPAYGRVPGGQNVKAGAYTDTLTILVTY